MNLLKKRIYLLIYLASAVFAGCAFNREPVPEPVITEVEEVKPTSGSIYIDGLGDCYADRRASRLGDILTVNIMEQASASQQASTQTGRQSGADVDLEDVFGLPGNLGMTNFMGAGTAFSPSLAGDYKRDFKGSGSTTRKENLVATITVRVVEVRPDGNLHIQGKRMIKVNREKQLISLDGIIRPEDISPTNTIASTYIADANIQYTGRGVIGDVQGPGWLLRIMDWIWPM